VLSLGKGKTGNVRTTQYSGAFLKRFLQWKSNKYHIFWVRICSLRYSTCNVHVPYCHLCLYGRTKFCSLCLINGSIFEKFLDMKFVVWFSLQLLSENFLVLRRTERDMIIIVHSYSSSGRYSCQILMKLEYCLQILEKCSNIKCHENPTNGNRVVPSRRTDSLVANSRFSQFCDRA